MAPSVTAGVSDEVAAELQVPIGPQMLEEVVVPMPAQRSWHSQSNRAVQRSLTHFPSQPWCKMCVESRGRDSRHREQLKIDAVVPADHVLPGADTSSGAIHATMVPDSKKMDMPCVVTATAKWVLDLEYERFYLHGDK